MVLTPISVPKPEEDGKAKQPGIIDTVSDTEGYIKVKSLNPWPDTDGDGIPDIWERSLRVESLTIRVMHKNQFVG